MSYRINCLKCVQSDWYHKWCCLNNYRLYDYVKGPLKFPMVTVPIPYEVKEKDEMDRCDCIRHVKECYSKPGIPDPWSEYLILRKETEKGRDASSTFPKCDLDITEYLDRHHRVYLGQGIPDPWKKWTYIEPLEPNFDNLKKNLKSYAENLRLGPGCSMYDVDKVCCPNCNRRLLILCVKKSNREEQEREKEVADADTVSKPVEEKLAEQKIYLKDACVETDYVPDAKNIIQISKACSCKLGKVCGCSNCPSCPFCNQSQSEQKTELCTRKKNYSCNCKRNSINNGYFYNAGSNFTMENKNTRQCIPLTDQSDSSPLSKLHHAHQGSILPFLCSTSDHCGCPAQQFIGFEEKNKHGLELQLVCPRCEKKRKKRRKTKSGQRKENQFPCHCRTNERGRLQKYNNEDECECNVCSCRCKAPHFKGKIKPKMSCYSGHLCHCEERNKTRIFEDGDYVRLLEILGCTSLFSNNLDCYKSKTTRNKISSKAKGKSIPTLNHSYWEDNTSDLNREGFQNFERGWMDHKCKQYKISGRSTGTNNEFEIADSKPNNKKQIPRRIPCNSHYTTDELRKMRSRSRRLKNKNAFRKELDHFLSNYSRLSDNSESSSRTRTGGKNTETKARQSSWQSGRNIT